MSKQGTHRSAARGAHRLQAEPREAGTDTGRHPSPAAVLYVVSVHDNYLVCKRASEGVLVGAAINVAKYPEVQKQEYHGLTFTDPTDAAVEWSFSYTGTQQRTVTSGDETEDQVIVPRYLPAEGDWTGSRIVAALLRTVVPGDAGGTVVCPWLELTNRAFAKVAE